MRNTIGAAVLMVAAIVAALAAQAQPYMGTLDEHPAIQYGLRPTTDRVIRLNDALSQGTRTLQRDDQTGYLTPVLDALGVSKESQLLVISKTGIQRDFTNPHNPRALYFNDSVAVGYIKGAPLLELAAHDPQQGVVFYTLEQGSASPRFKRGSTCVSCHLSANTLDVPGLIDRSNVVDSDGHVLPQLGNYVVNHTTPHTERWGGWFVTGFGPTPPYQPMGHLGNLTSSGPKVVSDKTFVEWMNSSPETHGYLSRFSDLAALQVFNHQSHAVNLLTRLNWDSRIGAPVGELVNELVDYFLFVDEAPVVVPVTPRPGFAEQLASKVPKDRRGRSLADLDLTKRLMRYPCSYMIYSDAFDGLAVVVKSAVYQRMLEVLSGKDTRYAKLSADDRRVVIEILHDTKPDFPGAP